MIFFSFLKMLNEFSFIINLTAVKNEISIKKLFSYILGMTFVFKFLYVFRLD